MMCNCASCTETDRFQGYIFEDGELIAETFPRQGFDAWPKGEHLRRSGKDKVYTAHWAFCGAEAHKKGPEKLDLRMHIGGRSYSFGSYASLPHYAPNQPEPKWIEPE